MTPKGKSLMESEFASGTAADDGAAIVRNIASFLNLSDATSIVSVVVPQDNDPSPADSWAVGEELFHLSESASIVTPPTPALIAVSPGATPHMSFDMCGMSVQEENEDMVEDATSEVNSEGNSANLEELFFERKRRWAQERIAAAVFAHPMSIRSYCRDAYDAAREIRNQKDTVPVSEQEMKSNQSSYLNGALKRSRRRRGREDAKANLLHHLINALLHNIPLSVLLDLTGGVVDTSAGSVHCTFVISVNSMKAIISALSRLIRTIWDTVTNFNPFALLDAIISLQVHAMGKTSEVLATGIQSVATGVGSASSLALHRLSRGGVGNLSVTRTGSASSSLGPNGLLSSGLRKRNSGSNAKLLRKVSSINSAAQVISYIERADDTGGLSQHAKSRVQRMMHYDVSLRPFVATVAMPTKKENSIDAINAATIASRSRLIKNKDRDDTSTTASSPMGSPFMCTPQSFPPTPASRSTVLARSSRFADDVIFLARDQLRVHDALASENERTREMARALKEGKRLAVFDAKDAGSGIELTCGQHLATKVGNMLYCSTKSMVPILRNCFVYFEMTVMPRPVANRIIQSSMVTLSLGLSTEEMPPNTLVGAWHGSVGLCTTGQILTSGQWCSPVDPSMSAYGESATVGCLVCLDDGSAFETWDGVMVTATVTFNVNGRIVTPPISSLPTGAGMQQGGEPQMGMMDGMGMMHGGMHDQFKAAQIPLMAAPASTISLLVPAAEELYPTVTLHSPASSIMCRFSAEDIRASSRELMGAPGGRTIYAVDGSVIAFPE